MDPYKLDEDFESLQKLPEKGRRSNQFAPEFDDTNETDGYSG